ncbi:MAG: MaoC family dehydratase [Desulfobacterales bacterium]|nr:MaoC family dehydratase [Desulfobacterales bacterium]MBS3755010.1 MaoC family dehydratase [Desulfobacterales bacterium]
MARVQFQTIDELRGHIGEEIAVGNWAAVTQDQINLFAEATGDYQWIHLDRQRAAAESPYGTTVAHGFLTLSMIPRFMEETVAFPPAKMSVNYGLNRVRFAAPVPAGSKIRPRVTLRDVKDIAGGAQIYWRVVIEVEGSEKPACVAETISLFYFR